MTVVWTCELLEKVLSGTSQLSSLVVWRMYYVVVHTNTYTRMNEEWRNECLFCSPTLLRPLNTIALLSRICKLLKKKISWHTFRSQIERYTLLLIFRKFFILPAVIWASPFISFQENFQPPCFFTYTNEKNSTLPAVIRA